MRYFLFLLLFIAVPCSAGYWNECSFVIADDPGNVDDRQPTGYKIYVLQATEVVHEVDVGMVLQSDCVAVMTSNDVGNFDAYATAYNDAGESDPSPTVSFVIDPLPGIPLPPTLNVQINIIP